MLGAGLTVWHTPVVHAARATGWDCHKTQAGLWECRAGETLPAAVPAPVVTETQGPVTPPAASLPAKPAEETPEKPVEEQQPASAEAEPAPEQPVPEPKRAATPAPVPSREPEPRPTPQRVESEPALAPRAVAVADKKADTTWELCPSQPRPAKIPVPAEGRASAALQLSADEADVAKEGISHFRGNVAISRADQRLNADNIDYDRDKELLLAKGNVSLQDNDMRIDGETARVDLNADQGVIEKANFRLYERHGRGSAAKIRRDGAANKTHKPLHYMIIWDISGIVSGDPDHANNIQILFESYSLASPS